MSCDKPKHAGKGNEEKGQKGNNPTTRTPPSLPTKARTEENTTKNVKNYNSVYLLCGNKKHDSKTHPVSPSPSGNK